MNVITQNPFRVLGLLSNSSERIVQRQLTKINLHAGIGKVVSFDDDFSFLGSISRTATDVQKASSQLEQVRQKVLYALFWFTNNSPVDEIALAHLRSGNTQKAGEVWDQTIRDRAISNRNISSVGNYSTLYLWHTVNNQPFNYIWFQTIIEWKRRLIESDAFADIVTTVAGENASIDKDLLLKDFLQEVVTLVLPYQSAGQLSRLNLIETFEKFPAVARQPLIDTFTGEPQRNIEKCLGQSKANRTDNPGDGEIHGEELYNATLADLQFLKDVWGDNNLQYNVLANNNGSSIFRGMKKAC